MVVCSVDVLQGIYLLSGKNQAFFGGTQGEKTRRMIQPGLGNRPGRHPSRHFPGEFLSASSSFAFARRRYFSSCAKKAPYRFRMTAGRGATLMILFLRFLVFIFPLLSLLSMGKDRKEERLFLPFSFPGPGRKKSFFFPFPEEENGAKKQKKRFFSFINLQNRSNCVILMMSGDDFAGSPEKRGAPGGRKSSRNTVITESVSWFR